ncbi:MAG: hypothetical protein KGY65_05695 [Candidatus Thermoplasmatota archaeon]|nr:hypothetical protein [Candidatus Thermoplasmatota archaeon]MBS3802225.1 hypothetical protein [Candidatus Thermoplasmatota archaeon]
MPLKNKATSITLCTLLLLSMVLSTLFVPSTLAEPEGKTKLYFKDILDVDNLEYDSTNQFPLLTEIPPTKENASSYPPIFIKGLSFREGLTLIDNETLYAWLATWVTSLFDDFEGLEGFEEFEELFKQMELIFPNPLRIVEAYENTDNESIQLNGNVEYDLYFKTKISSQINNNDKVKLSIYTYSETAIVPTEIANETIALNPGLFQNSMQQSITLTNISQTVNPGQLLLFSIEMIPGNKTLTSIIDQEYPLLKNISNMGLKIIRNLANNSEITAIEDAFAIIDEITMLLEEGELGVNFSKEDVSEFLESIISFSFLYDSSDYPSSVTVPFKAEGETDENSNTYYLHSNNNMDKTRPTASSQQTLNLADAEGTWMGEEFSRNKIISDASAIIYISHKDAQRWSSPMEVKASLLYGNETISTDSVTLDATGFFSSSTKPYRFTFENLGSGVELDYGKEIGFSLSLENTSNVNSLLRSVNAFYDSNDYASMLSFSISETDHISVSGSSSPSDGKIIVGDIVTYDLEINSDLEDSISVGILDSSFESAEKEFWDVSISPPSFSINSDGTQTVTVTLSSLGTSLVAYEEDPLQITLEIIGNTGYDTIQLTAEVSDDAVIYDTIIKKPSDRKIVHGTNETFSFVIKNNNTGLWKNSFIFSANVDKNFSVIVDPLTFDNLEVKNETTVNVTVIIPEDTEIDEATLTLAVISKRSDEEYEVQVNMTIIGANIFETTFDYFDDIAESLGLKDVLGSYAAVFLVAIIFIAVFFILILVAFILTTKYVDVICLDRIKEIDPGNTATYEISLKNIRNKTNSYQIYSDLAAKSSPWNISISPDTVTIPPKQQRTIMVTVETTDEINPGDWKEFHVIVETQGKSKKEQIPLFCSLTNGSTSLSIKDVFHWPKSFSKDEKVSTSFRLKNKGSVQARHIAVKLFINNKEKNKVEELIIPAGGHADITLPWIAEKGKNDLRILIL